MFSEALVVGEALARCTARLCDRTLLPPLGGACNSEAGVRQHIPGFNTHKYERSSGVDIGYYRTAHVYVIAEHGRTSLLFN
jgi:hypothetical protein